MAPDLPPSIRVIVRGWLNCNLVVMRAPGENVLVDSGYCTHRERTLELLASREGLDREPLERLVNTHCHSDHMGGNAAIERLRPAIVIPGHGAPFSNAPDAIARVRSKLAAFERDPAKNARHVAKVMFAFALLDRQAMNVADVPAYLGRVPCYRQLSKRFLGLEAPACAESPLADPPGAGAIIVHEGVVRPTMTA